MFLVRAGKKFQPQIGRGVIAAAAVAAFVFAGVYSGGLFSGTSAQAAVDASAASVLRRLTELQYKNIIRDVFGPDIKIGGRFDPDMREEGLLEVGAGQASISASALGQYVTMDKTGRRLRGRVSLGSGPYSVSSSARKR